MTGRWPQLDRRIRSVAALNAQASVFDRTLGHFVTGHWVGAFGLADMATQRRGEGPDADAASDRDLPDAFGRS